jgi:hypothetical protein
LREVPDESAARLSGMTNGKSLGLRRVVVSGILAEHAGWMDRRDPEGFV